MREDTQLTAPQEVGGGPGFSSWPPNCLRIADSSWLAKSARPWDSNRAKRAALITGAGTPDSTAAANVQRPSPEPETRPVNPLKVGSSRSALAVRSSNQ